MPASSPQPQDSIHVKIQTPTSVVWEGNAEVVSSKNSDGNFDVLPDHGNFITIIDNAPIEIISSVGRRNFTFEKAIMSLNSNNLMIFANIETNAEN